MLGKVGAGIAAPFTGGLSLAAIPAIDALGAVTSGAAKGSADQRSGENRDALGYGQLANNQAQAQFSADLAGANYQREGQDRARRMALLSALLGGAQDSHITPGNPAIAAKMGASTGGLRPSALAGNQEALLALLGGQQDPAAPTYTPAALPQLQKAGGFEKVLGGIGLGGSILGALGKRTQDPRVMSGIPTGGGART